MRPRIGVSALLAVLLSVHAPALAAGWRCGWLINPTPANFSLMNREAEWSLSMQGGPRAEGLDTMPDMTRRGWVTTNGSYGYGCACLEVVVNRNKHRITRLLSAQPVPLSRCRADRALPSP